MGRTAPEGFHPGELVMVGDLDYLSGYQPIICTDEDAYFPPRSL